MELIVLGMDRVHVLNLETTEPFLRAHTQAYPFPDDTGPEVEALHHEVIELATQAIALAQPQAPQELKHLLVGTEDPLRLAFLLASMFSLESDKEQALLEAQTRADALRLTHSYLAHEVQVLELRSKIASTAQTEMSKEQREYLLRQQLRAIQQELGEKNPEQAEVDLLRERLEKADLPEDVRKEAARELSRLERLPAGAPDYHVIRT
jgi:ATP-dependent Lon protease